MKLHAESYCQVYSRKLTNRKELYPKPGHPPLIKIPNSIICFNRRIIILIIVCLSQLPVAVGKKQSMKNKRKVSFWLRLSEFGSCLLRLFADFRDEGHHGIEMCGVKLFISQQMKRATEKGERRDGGKQGERAKKKI